MKGNLKEKKGITLIALVITIIVMLILVAVTISMAINGGLFKYAGNATRDTKNALAEENSLASGRIKIGDIWYDSIDAYINNIPSQNQGEDVAVDFEELFRTAQKHPDQTETNDIGIAEDGSIVNLDLWHYARVWGNEEEWEIGHSGSGGYNGYDGEIVDGKIQGQIPMYIKTENEDEFLPVTIMQGLLQYSDKGAELKNAPKIPSTVTTLYYTFEGCSGLTTVSVIPNGVKSMNGTFTGCISLAEAPVIPSSVKDMVGTFWGCTNLTVAPVIPSSVTDMTQTFYGCTSLTGTLTINANPIGYADCFSNCATNDGCNLVLNGSSTMLNELLGTKSDNSHISIAQ